MLKFFSKFLDDTAPLWAAVMIIVALVAFGWHLADLDAARAARAADLTLTSHSANQTIGIDPSCVIKRP